MNTLKIAGPLLLLTGCMGTPVVTSTPNSCATLIPQEWANGVPGPDLPSGDTVADWITFGDSAIGKLDQANGRQRDTMSIISACEKRDAKAVTKATKRWWQIF